MKALLSLIFACLLADDASAVSLTLHAITTASPASDTAGQDVDADNRLRAYSSGGIAIDGWMKFDTTGLPGPVVVTSARLVLFAEGVAGSFTSVSGATELEVRHSSYDGWTRGGAGFPASSSATLISAGDAGPFPVTPGMAYSFDLLTAGIDWTAYLSDGELSLLVDVAAGSGDGWSYWYGSGERPQDNTVGGNAGDDPVLPAGYGALAPQLILEYTVIPEPSVPLLLAAAGLTGWRRRRLS